MNVGHVDTVRKLVGAEKLEVLTDIFHRCEGQSPRLQKARYRADHAIWLDILDGFENDNLFLRRDDTGSTYALRVYAIPLLIDQRASGLLDLMAAIYAKFKELYHVHLNNMISINEIVSTVSAARNDVQEALYYLADAHNVWSGLSNGFPYADDAKIGISESVLRYADFGYVLSEFYEWHFVNPRQRASAWQPLRFGNDAAAALGFFTENDVSIPPRWYELLDDKKKALISELDNAVRNNLSALPTMGLRTLIELVMFDHIQDQGTFQSNLRAFRQAGYVTEQHAELIETVVDAGHASIHRAYFPDPSTLRTCIDVVKHLMWGAYVLKPAVDSVADSTPKRAPPDGKGY